MNTYTLSTEDNKMLSGEPLPMIGDIVVVRRGVVRRAKLYYLRDVTGKAARIKERKVVRTPKAS